MVTDVAVVSRVDGRWPVGIDVEDLSPQPTDTPLGQVGVWHAPTGTVVVCRSIGCAPGLLGAFVDAAPLAWAAAGVLGARLTGADRPTAVFGPAAARRPIQRAWDRGRAAPRTTDAAAAMQAFDADLLVHGEALHPELKALVDLWAVECLVVQLDGGAATITQRGGLSVYRLGIDDAAQVARRGLLDDHFAAQGQSPPPHLRGLRTHTICGYPVSREDASPEPLVASITVKPGQRLLILDPTTADRVSPAVAEASAAGRPASEAATRIVDAAVRGAEARRLWAMVLDLS